MGYPELIRVFVLDGNRDGNIERLRPVNVQDEFDAALMWRDITHPDVSVTEQITEILPWSTVLAKHTRRSKIPCLRRGDMHDRCLAYLSSAPIEVHAAPAAKPQFLLPLICSSLSRFMVYCASNERRHP